MDLIEARAALHARLGHAREAEGEASAAIARAPERARLYAILSEARRALGDLDGALDAVDAGLRKVRDDGLLVTERGIVLARRGDSSGAEAAWKQVLRHDAVHASAFVNLATLAAEKKDLPLAQALVDQALAAPDVHPEVARRAVQLAVATEVDGIPRAARIAKLATLLVTRAAGDAWAHLVLAQARVRLGEIPEALLGFARVMQLAPKSALFAEAQRERLACSDPRASLEVEAVLRAAETAEPDALAGIAARARSLGLTHGVWTASFASGVAERRLARWPAARAAFDEALRRAPGATPAHLELVDVGLALGDAASALEHAEEAVRLEGRSPRVLVALARALSAAGRSREAVEVAREGLTSSPEEPTLVAIATRGGDAPPARPSFWESLRRKMGG
jgi:tetratricopeptide (TPR) repeat protein